MLRSIARRRKQNSVARQLLSDTTLEKARARGSAKGEEGERERWGRD